MPPPTPAAVPGRRPSADSASDDDDFLYAPLPSAALPAPTRYAVGDAVEARWEGGPEFYPAIIVGVHAVRGWNKLDLQYSDGSGDKESGVVEALVRPLKRRRAAATDRGDSDGDDSAPAWASDVRELLVEIKAVQSRMSRRVVLEDLRQQLTSRGFHHSSCFWKPDPYIRVPANFPCYYNVWGKDNYPKGKALAIRAFSALVKYLERALALAGDGVAVRLESERSVALAVGDADDKDDKEDDDSSEDAEESDVGGRASSRRTIGVLPKACEVRRVGHKKWRRFVSRADAERAFPCLSRGDIGKLINNRPGARIGPHVREEFEARNAVDEADDDDVAGAVESTDAKAGGEALRDGGDWRIEMRRVGDSVWRRFESRAQAAQHYGLAPSTLGRFIRDPSSAPILAGKFETRCVVDDDAKVEGEEEEEAATAKDDDRQESPATAALIGRTVRIWWPHHNEWFTGRVNAFDGNLREITYDDDTTWDEFLADRRWELVDEAGAEEDDAAGAEGDDDAASGESPQKQPDEAPCCPICLEPLDAAAPALGKCGHRIHADCLFGAGKLVSHAWADNAPSTRRGQQVECPTCRQHSWVPAEEIEQYRTREK